MELGSGKCHPSRRTANSFHRDAVGWPHSWGDFFSVQSPLAPHVYDQRFFAYGSFPIYLLALLGYCFHIQLTDPGSIVTLSYLGRVLSALFDSGTILLTALLALRLTGKAQSTRGWSCALLAATLVAVTPLQLQLSHFFAVDTILLFFVMLTLLSSVYIVETKRILLWSIIAGVGYGLALGTKFSAAPLAVPVCAAFLLRWYRQHDWSDVLTGLRAATSSHASKVSNGRSAFSFLMPRLATSVIPCLTGLYFAAATTVIVFLLVEPYALINTGEFVQQVSEQGSMARGGQDFPFIRQFAGTTPYIYELQNMVLWGMGIL